ncbi:MAG: hypothetical protein WCG23_12335 [bacterium]
MNNLNQNQMEVFSGGKAQIPAQSQLSPQGQAVSSQYGQEQKAEQGASRANFANNQQAVTPQNSFSPKEITQEMKNTYENIFHASGVDAANNWLKQQIVNNHLNLQLDNEALIREVHAKYGDLYAVPVIKEAIQAFIDLDLDPNLSLRSQGFHDAMDHMANIYRAGYDDALNLKNQNDSAKARMTSAVNSAVPHYQSNKIFTRSEIKSMSPDDFVRNEKTIFEQLNKGLIK